MLCANPAASGLTGGLFRDVLARLRRQFEVTVKWPETPADARMISAAATDAGFDAVVAMGGDGVVHHVANGVGGTSTPLGIIPAGSANVLARLVDVPAKPIRAADFLCTRPAPRPVPAAMLTLDTGSGRAERRLATFSFGVGLDAAVVQRAEQSPHRKLRLPALHYAASALAVAWNEYPATSSGLKVASADRSATASAVLVRVYDRYTYFGRLPIRYGPHQPGTMGVLIVRSLNRRKIPAVLSRAITGRDLAKVDGFEVWTGIRSLEVTCASAGVIAQADGELLGTRRKLSVEAEADHLRVLRPG